MAVGAEGCQSHPQGSEARSQSSQEADAEGLVPIPVCTEPGLQLASVCPVTLTSMLHQALILAKLQTLTLCMTSATVHLHYEDM